ncbi:hypothetical protein BCR39DRAFT_551788 [Naematelia encephala]|uniref:Uncharacterized protein n=1 Tax=Naematelia encephala TaxID=71784 RepID=A0A1Y2AK41_9TREE|nr:hypothetical protein BCR39DRAFT_551788 [Naematelia encephala]
MGLFNAIRRQVSSTFDQLDNRRRRQQSRHPETAGAGPSSPSPSSLPPPPPREPFPTSTASTASTAPTVTPPFPIPSSRTERYSDHPSTIIQTPTDPQLEQPISLDVLQRLSPPPLAQPLIFRSSLRDELPYDRDVYALRRRVEPEIEMLVQTTEEPDIQTIFGRICDQIIRPKSNYWPVGGDVVQPQLRFYNQLNIGYLNVNGGKALDETIFDRNVKALYEVARASESYSCLELQSC